jgi:proteasome lid subunit RPN8/RPN11
MAAHPPLEFPHQAYAEMIAHAYAGYPLEACGLLVGSGSTVHRFVPCTNEAASARIYAIPGKELLRAERAADDDGLAITASPTRAPPTWRRHPTPTGIT